MSDKRVTVSKILINRNENILLRYFCEEAAKNGGCFSLVQEWMGRDWWNVYTIEWPDGFRIPGGA